MRFLLIFALLFLSACGAEDVLFPLVSDEEHIEIITLGPYTGRCHDAHFERDCLMEYNEDSGRWEFFYESIQGFDFEPGFIYILQVRLEDRGPYIQDVGRYAYHLVKIIAKQKAPDDFSYD
jgi:hypothetical protein